MLSHRFRTTALLTLTTAALAACGADVHGTAHPAEIDVRTLDVGKYSTDPLELRYTYDPSMANGFNLAVQRLADHVVTGPDIDPMLVYGTGAITILDAEKATKVLAKATQPVLTDNHMMFGISVGHSEKEPDKSGAVPPGSAFTTVTVLQFPDAAAASKAAQELDDADFGVAPDLNQRVSLPKYPDAHAHWRPGVASIGSTWARGNYVVDLYVGVKDPDLSQLTALAEKVYAAQGPLLDSLKPLDREGILRLPYDSEGMRRQTLVLDGGWSPNFVTQAVAEPRGYLHRVTDQDYWRRVLSDYGVDRFANSGASYSGSTMLFRTRDAQAAGKLADLVLERGYSVIADVPTGIPGAKCGESTAKSQYSSAKRYRCVLSYRRYAASVESDQLADVRQRAAAQYALLANSTW
ncbi:hypothetical protein JMUB6875_52130 [Nocardia sp. JMUB6875]|uniref:DUF7373 family lipoprotein n=1 Tax=Nocardia sp. JMUB6875 TaxID=3158170 RepID=UPI0032E779E2